MVNNASPLFPGNFQKALDEFDVNDDGLIDYSEFLELDRRYPLVLFPAFKLQDCLQKHTLGLYMYMSVYMSIYMSIYVLCICIYRVTDVYTYILYS